MRGKLFGPPAWKDDWTPPPGYSDMLTDLSASRAADGERKLKAIFQKRRSAAWRGRAQLALGIARLRRHEWQPADKALAEAEKAGGAAAAFASLRRADALMGAGNAREALAQLDRTRPGDIDPALSDEVATDRARALAALGESSRAHDLLAAYLRSPACRDRARVLEADAKIAEEAGQTAAAVDLYRRIYLEEPRSREAPAALDRLSTLAAPSQRLRASDLPAIAARARTQIRAGDGRGALATWDQALAWVPSLAGDLRWRPDIAEAAVEARELDRAIRLLGRGPVRKGDSRRGWLIGRILASEDRNAQAIAALQAAAAASDEAADAAQFQLATVLDQTDRDRQALAEFRVYMRRFPKGGQMPAATWRAAWLSFRLSDRPGATQLFTQLLSLEGASAYAPSAAYWLGRTLEAQGRTADAIDRYRRLATDSARDYYGILARRRLTALGAAAPAPGTGPAPAADGVAGAEHPGESWGSPLGRPTAEFCTASPVAADAAEANTHIRAGCEMEMAGLIQDAEREYEMAAANGAALRSVRLRLSEIAMRRGDRPAAIARLKSAIPNYLGAPLSALPKDYWEILYPRPNWDQIAASARAQRLDPALVCGLILQESGFNPLAVSGAGAMGLMQVLPETGGDAARALREGRFTSARLFEPATNVRIGTWHLADLLARFNGRVEITLAAYNAGEARVRHWQSAFATSDPTVFIEEIPYTETRLYVKRILSHAAMYEAIYGS